MRYYSPTENESGYATDEEDVIKGSQMMLQDWLWAECLQVTQ